MIILINVTIAFTDQCFQTFWNSSLPGTFLLLEQELRYRMNVPKLELLAESRDFLCKTLRPALGHTQNRSPFPGDKASGKQV
jgi:hypothetical protein